MRFFFSQNFNLPALRLLVMATLALPVQAAVEAEPAYARTSHYVEVRDGTRLAMNVYRPVVDGAVIERPLPVIFFFTPYRARYRSANGAVLELTQARSMGLDRLLAAGYVLAEADIRGKGASFGARRGFQDRTEANDGHDLVQWLASQQWSDGKVGMAGCSYLGGTTMHVATTRPPALKAVFIGASDIDKFDFVRRGGITAQFNTRPDEPLSDDLMSLPMDEDADGAMLRAAVAQHADNTPMAQLWYSMPFRDSVSELTGNAFWLEAGPYTYFEALQRPGLATYVWSNLKDEPTAHAILAAANLGGKLLIGPGGHCAPPPGFDLGAELKRYFDHYLKEEDNGIEREPRNTWWVENAPAERQWVRSDALPGSTAQATAWFLGSAGETSLTKNPGPPASTSFTVDYAVGGGEYFSFWVEPQDEHGLVFTGATLDRDLHLEGYPVLHLALAADTTDANVFAYLEEVDAQGVPSVLAMGRLAASYRATAAAPYENLGLPWHPGTAASNKPLVPGATVELQISLLPVSRIIPAGHRLRLVVTGADPRQRNLEQIRQNPAPTITLRTGGEQGSRIELPILE